MHCKVGKKIVSLKKTYRQGSEKKMQAAKERCYRDPEQSHEDSIEKGNISKILKKEKNIKRRNIRKILSQNQKRNIRKIQNKKENMKKTNMQAIPNKKRI